ncbi:MAG: ATP-binding cassette domain-containing protein [Bacteroidetes bacterium]|nr:MAG: ATP-binding cassette domain-containing protein [Bacteroidota bacterium]
MEVEKGELIALTGPSGSGKTTFLRLLAGLIRPEGGYLRVGDSIWWDAAQKHFLPPQKRPTGFVFQNYALFPNMTVRQNLAFALPRNGNPQTVDELMEMVRLRELSDRLPHQLSGGQQQRVALARALVRRPKILLLDEPLSALDPAMRRQLQSDLKHLHDLHQLTTILVSHDTSEIFKLADRVFVLEAGHIAQSGLPRDILKPEGLLATIVAMEPGGPWVKLTCRTGTDQFFLTLPAEKTAGFQVGHSFVISDLEAGKKSG